MLNTLNTSIQLLFFSLSLSISNIFRDVSTDEDGKMDVDHLEKLVKEDIAKGKTFLIFMGF